MDTSASTDPPPKPCRACQDFKSWSKKNVKDLNDSPNVDYQEEKDSRASNETSEVLRGPPSHCPLDRETLGRNTWSFLHTMAAYYPDDPTEQQQKEVNQFFVLFSHFYPCHDCAQDLQQQIKRFPPKTTSQHELSQWLCRVHNRINLRLGKAQFDCSKVNERWRDGWPDGSCD